MSNIRILYENIADTATITANSTMPGFSTDSLKTEYKSLAHRTSSTSVIYEVTWAQDEAIGGIVLPATNLSGTSTISVEVWNKPPSEPIGRRMLASSGVIYAAPGSAIDDWDWSFAVNVNTLANGASFDVNNFAFGLVSKTAVWFENQVAGRYCIISINDALNPKGYIDCSRLVIGSYWESTFNVKRDSLSITVNDTSTTTRTNAGDLVSDRGFIHDVLNFDFSILDNTSKETLMKILRSTGTHKNICVSIFPEENTVREQDFLIYGKISASSPISHVYNKFYTQSLNIVGW